MIKSTLKIFALVLGFGVFVFGASSCKKDDKSCCTGTDEDGVKKTMCEGESYEGVALTGTAWTEFKAMAIKYGATCD